MVHFCAVFGCSSRWNREKDKSYYRLPAVKKNVNKEKQLLQEQRRNEWLKRIRRDEISLKTPEKFPNIRVCSDHFISGQPASLFDKGNPDWAPNERLGHNSVKRINPERHERYILKEQKRLRKEVAEALLELSSSKEPSPECSTNPPDPPLVRECSTQIDLTLEHLHAIEMEMDQLRLENREVKQKLIESSLNEDAFKEDDEKVLFYTGLPNWQLLYCVFNFVAAYLPQSSRCVLSPFQRLLLTLMRMRLNLSGKDLAYRFGGIHETTISRIFLQVLDVLHSRLSPLIHWPSRDQLLKTLPMDFRKNCPACVVIIDCFEIFLERATNPLARAQTYSSYKHHNTVKYLIGITPQGSVSFISKGWGGRVSDKHLTEESGLLEKLIPCDVILADRGFDIQESVGLYCARIKIPAFTKGKNQLSGIEVEQTRRIANVRIHVERVIGNVTQ